MATRFRSFTLVLFLIAVAVRAEKLPPAEDFLPDPLPEIRNGTVEGDLGKKLDEQMQTLANDGFSGVLLVVKNDRVILAKGYGSADRTKGTPYTTDTVFDIGSITKQFTGAAILKLEMQGKLQVADLISKYFQDVPDDKKEITLHHLLTHSAGFVDSLGGDYQKIDRDAFVKLALASKLRSTPGRSYHYSNVGYSLLGAVVELVSGQGYEQYLHENLFKPAGMAKTGYLIPHWGKDELAHGYRKDRDWGAPRDHAWADDGPFWHLRANGGILSTVGDLYRWHLALQGDEILSKDAKEKYYAHHIREGRFSSTFYGYGWSVGKTSRNTRLVEHNGGNGIFFADFKRFLDEGTVLIIASNVAEKSAMDTSDRLARLLFKE